MTQQTGNDRYAGTTPNRQTQARQAPSGGAMTGESGQSAVQMDQQTRRGQRDERRQQAGAQSDQGLGERGFGYGAQDGEEMEDAPDASERGYGGATEKREEKLDDEK